MARDGGVRFAHATKHEQLKSIEAGKGLQLDQARDESILHVANSKIHDQKRRMCRFIRHLQAGWNRSRRMSREFRSAGLSHDFLGSRYDFVVKLAREKDRCLRDAEIGRPFLSFVYAPQQCRVLFRSEIGVETGAKFRLHEPC